MEATKVRRVTLATGKDWVIPGSWYTLRKTAPTTQIPGQNRLLYANSGATEDRLVYWFNAPIRLRGLLVGEFALGEAFKIAYVCGGACTGLTNASAGITWNNCVLSGLSTTSNCVRIEYTDDEFTTLDSSLLVRLAWTNIYGWAFALSPSPSWPADLQYCDSVQLLRQYITGTP